MSGLRPDATHVLEIGSRTFELRRHDKGTLASQRESTPLSSIPERRLTHFVEDVPFPADAVQSYFVSYSVEGTRLRGLSLAGLHVPQRAIASAQQLKTSSLGMFDFRRSSTRPLDLDETRDLADFNDTFDAARWVVYHHPEILSLDPVACALLLGHIDSSPSLADLANTIGSLGVALRPDDDPESDAWARGVPTIDPTTGKQSLVRGDDGKMIGEWHYELNPEVIRALRPVIVEALAKVRNDDLLEDRRYHPSAARDTRSGVLPDTNGLLKASSGEPAPAGGAAYDWTPLAEQWDAGQVVHDVTSDGGRTVTVTVSNSFYRHLGVFFAYADGQGKLLTRAQSGAGPGDTAMGVGFDTDYLQFAGIVDPPPWLLGLPISGLDAARLKVTAKIPDAARKLHVLTGSIASDAGDFIPEHRGVFLPGAVLTMALEYGFPTLALAYGALTTAPGWTALLDELKKIVAKTVALKLAPQILTGKSIDWKGVGIYAANETLKSMLSAGGTAAALWAGVVVAGQATKAIPIVGIALYAIQAADTAHAMLRTSLDIAESKQCARTEITSTNSVRVKATPKEKTGFAKTGTSWRLFVTPEGGNTLVSTGPFDPIATPATFDATLARVPSGGTARYRLEILSCSGWPAATAEGSFTNVVAAGGTEALVDAVVVNTPVPIDETTRYSPRARIDLVQNRTAHAWVTDRSTPPVGAVIACPGGIEKICDPAAITIDVDRAQIAYSWQSAQVAVPVCEGSPEMSGTATWSVQNLNLDVTLDNASPDATLKTLGCGLQQRVLPVYGLRGPRPFVLEASSGTYHLREVFLDRASSSDFRKGQSWGRFTSIDIRAAALHKSGIVMTASGEADKLEVLKLVRGGPDGEAPRASMRSGAGAKRGNVLGVVAITAAFDGDAFLVLEDGNKRIQAFGLTGARIDDYFDVPAVGPSPFLELPKDRVYRDIGIELVSGTIYVLSIGGSGRSTQDYELSIYGRKRGLIATTTGFVASRMALDADQNVYGLGFDALRLRERREPGVWLWIPSTPPGGLTCP